MSDAPRWRRWAGRGLALAFLAVVAWFAVRHAQTVDWAAVGHTLRTTPPPVLLTAAVLAASSHALYSTFDLIGRRYTGHPLAVRRVMAVTFVSYAFNLNLGYWVGGIAFRYRLYARLGLDTGTTTRILTLSMLTNWLGYLVVAGAVFTLRPPQLPPAWAVGTSGLRVLGVGMLCAAALYLALCAGGRVQVLRLRGHELPVPGAGMVGVQLLLSCTNWAVMGSVLWVLMQGRVPYVAVLAVLLVAAVAGAITHVPAGLGVLEAVFVALLSHRLPESGLLGALLAYRALYYLVPWLAAAILYFVMEARAAKGA